MKDHHSIILRRVAALAMGLLLPSALLAMSSGSADAAGSYSRNDTIHYAENNLQNYAAPYGSSQPPQHNDNCTWFVSESEIAGGLPIQAQGWTDSLITELLNRHLAIQVNSIAQLQPGDIIAYHWSNPSWNGDATWGHLALYLGNDRVVTRSISGIPIYGYGGDPGENSFPYNKFSGLGEGSQIGYFHILSPSNNYPVSVVSPRLGGVQGTGWIWQPYGGVNGESWYAPSSGTQFAAYTKYSNPELEGAGVYNVQIWVPIGDADAIITYEIHHAGRNNFVTLDQANLAGWQNIGNYGSNGQKNFYVWLSSNDGQTNTVIGVDQMKFTYLGN